MTATTTDTKLRAKVKSVLRLESQLDNLTERVAEGIKAAWDLHQQVAPGGGPRPWVSGELRPSMEAWAAVWAEERKAFDGKIKLAAGVRRQIVQSLVGEGISNRAIAAALGIGLGTANRDAEGAEPSSSPRGADGSKQRQKPDTAKRDAGNRRRARTASDILGGIVCRGKHATALNRAVSAMQGVKPTASTATAYAQAAQALADLVAELAGIEEVAA